jgi:hypothetical protein
MIPTSICMLRRPPATPRGPRFSNVSILFQALVVSPTPVIYTDGSLILQSIFNASEVIKLIQPERVDYNYMFGFAENFPWSPAGKIPKGELRSSNGEVEYGQRYFLNAVSAAPFGC